MRLVVGIGAAEKPKKTLGLNFFTSTVWFDLWRQLVGVLSDENRILLRLIHENRPPMVLKLAELSGRTASNFSRTLKISKSAGLVKMNCFANSQAFQPEAIKTDLIVVPV